MGVDDVLNLKDRPRCLSALLGACRPRQWPKNLLVFAAPRTYDVWVVKGC